jgi:hypothetical protein
VYGDGRAAGQAFFYVRVAAHGWRGSTESKFLFRDDDSYDGIRLERGTELFLENVVKTGADVGGQIDGFGITEELHGVAKLIDDQRAVPAILEVQLELEAYRGLQVAIEVVRDFAVNVVTIHWLASWRK